MIATPPCESKIAHQSPRWGGSPGRRHGSNVGVARVLWTSSRRWIGSTVTAKILHDHPQCPIPNWSAALKSVNQY
eukprot:1912852-Pyramimonas_sp.AAC.1